MAIGVYVPANGIPENYSYDFASFDADKKLGADNLDMVLCPHLGIWQPLRTTTKDGYHLLIFFNRNTTGLDQNPIATALVGDDVYGDVIITNVGAGLHGCDFTTADLTALVALAEITPPHFSDYFAKIDPAHRGEDRKRRRKAQKAIRKKFSSSQWRHRLIPELQ